MQGQVRFLSRVFRLVEDFRSRYRADWTEAMAGLHLEGLAARLRRQTHQAIQKATADIDRFSFNTYVSALMIFLNGLGDALPQIGEDEAAVCAMSEAIETLVLLLAPGAPHSADELWASLGHPGFTYDAAWPVAIAELAREDTVTIAVQVNGKLRDTLEMPAGSGADFLEAAARASDKIQGHMEGKTVRKVVVVPDKLVNLVVG
jgi:leucyl-tRNA synthetase